MSDYLTTYADLSRDDKQLAYELGERIAKRLSPDVLAAMIPHIRAASVNPATCVGADLTDLPPANGWQLLALALDEAWAHAQSKQDAESDAPAVPMVGPALPCSRPPLHNVHGYRTTDGKLSLDWSAAACGAHAYQYRERIAAVLGQAHVNVPMPLSIAGLPNRECGHVYDLAATRPAAREASK